MRTILNISVLVFLLVVASGWCFAMMSIETVSEQRAKDLGLEIRATAAGPDDVWVELEFPTRGELEKFVRVDLEISDGKKRVSASLQEDRSKPGRVAVSFTADRVDLDKITLRVVTGVAMDMTGHDLRVKDFVDLKKVR
jgi:hypothetical protein